jgi:hypothetical protein
LVRAAALAVVGAVPALEDGAAFAAADELVVVVVVVELPPQAARTAAARMATPRTAIARLLVGFIHCSLYVYPPPPNRPAEPLLVDAAAPVPPPKRDEVPVEVVLA